MTQLGKDSCFAYEDLVEKGELTRIACQKARYSGQQGLQVVQDFDVLGSEGFFLLCTLLRVLRQGIISPISLALMIVNLELIAREFLSLTDLSGVQTLCFHKLADVVMFREYENLMLRPF